MPQETQCDRVLLHLSRDRGYFSRVTKGDTLSPPNEPISLCDCDDTMIRQYYLRKLYLADVSDILYFFRFWSGEKGGRVRAGGRGRFSIGNRGRGGGSEEAGCVHIGHGEVRVYRGRGVSRGVRRTTWERSLKNWEIQISCFDEFFWGGNTLGLVPASLPHALGYACAFYGPTSPPQAQAPRGCLQ